MEGKELVKVGQIQISSNEFREFVKSGGYYLIEKVHPTFGPRYDVYEERIPEPEIKED